MHAYERSVEHYREVRQTLGELDPFRLRYIDRIAELVGAAARDGLRPSEYRRWRALQEPVRDGMRVR